MSIREPSGQASNFGHYPSYRELVVSLDLTRRFLGDTSLGLFGAGHLGRAIAVGLLLVPAES